MAYNWYDQENQSPANKGVLCAEKKGVLCAETAVVARFKKPKYGVMLAISGLPSHSEYESADEDVNNSLVYCVRVMQLDAPQSPLGEQTKPMYVYEIGDVTTRASHG